MMMMMMTTRTRTRTSKRGSRQHSPLVALLLLVLVLAVSHSSHSINTDRHGDVSGVFFFLGTPVVQAFAAAKNKRKGKGGAGKGKGDNKPGGFGGFGTPPPTFEHVLANIRTTHIPEDADSKPCPCGSKVGFGYDQAKTYAECCGPLLAASATSSAKGDGGCMTAMQVLQSRYTAFCYRNVGHVILTTHEECRDYRDDKIAWAKDLDKEGMFDSFEFVGLEILDDDKANDGNDNESEEDDASNKNEAFLEFQVRLRGRSLEESPVRSRSLSSVEGEETVVAERSRFLRDRKSGVWKYAGGDVRSKVKGLEDTRLNS